jgi:hypothetical protein
MTLPNGAFPRFLAPVPQAIQEAIDRAALVGGGALAAEADYCRRVQTFQRAFHNSR